MAERIELSTMVFSFKALHNQEFPKYYNYNKREPT